MAMHIRVKPAKRYLKKDFFKINDFPLQILHMDSSMEYPLHSHDFCEIVIVYSGESIHQYNNIKKTVKTGDVIFIPIGNEHAYECVNNFSYLNIIFDESIVSPKIINFNKYSVTHLSSFDLQPCIDILNMIDKELYRKEINYKNMMSALFLSFLIDLKRSIIKSENDNENYISTRNRIINVVEIVKRNPTKNYTLDSLANLANTSVRNFTRLFKNQYKTTIIKYINALRIQESINLLKNTEFTIYQIALLVGYEDASYFSTIFKNLMKTSPLDYRTSLNSGNLSSNN